VKVFGEYVWKTYTEVGVLRDAIGSALVKRNMVPENDQKLRLVGLFSKNREEWVIAEQACHAYGMADVALYDTLGDESIQFIIQQTGMSTVFVSGDLLPKLLATVEGSKGDKALTSLKYVVCFDPVDATQSARTAGCGLTLLDFNALLMPRLIS